MSAADASALPENASASPTPDQGRRTWQLRRPVLNPMTYKELTQGARSGAFVALFFLLMVCGLTITLFGPLLGSIDQRPAGKAVFALLASALHIYGLIVGVRAFMATGKEIENKTFELYALAGMTPEKMVLGKATTAFYIFFFGLSCLAPFMFASYFMRGLDFRAIYQVLAVLILLHVQYLMAMTLAGMTRAQKRYKVGVILLALGGSLFLMFYGLTAIFWVLENPLSSPAGGVLMALSLGMSGFGVATWDVVTGLAAFHLFCFLIMFYWSCHVACSETDSREHILKFLLLFFYIFINYLILLFEFPELYLGFYYFFWYCFLGYGLLFWINREDVPIIVRNKAERGWLPTRLALRLFEPGRLGTARCLFLMAVAAFVAPLARAIFVSLPAPSSRVFSSYTEEQVIAITLTLPGLGLFLLAIADTALGTLRAQRINPPLRRATTLLAWGFIATLTAVFATVFSGSSGGGFGDHPLVATLGLTATPFLTPWAVSHLMEKSDKLAWTICGAFGVAGMFLIMMDARRVVRERFERRGEIGRELMETLRREGNLPSMMQSAAPPRQRRSFSQLDGPD
jgi:hypothetical protein